ncbi:MAG: ABC transporter permease [Chloroflexaceae bacterium]|nr:ABC transporter permease [Chloroflexaceae bacterium]NJO06585.1 ABC transporter permease [Chloroflexaceae bacterium]
MEVFVEAFAYATENMGELWNALLRHLLLVATALGVGVAVCVPLGVWTARSRFASATFINLFNTLRVIPSLAILFLALPYFGLSFESAAIALTILALPPILINTDAAFRNINPAVREAARGMGMGGLDTFWQVEFPLALPVILAGIRTSLVEVIASATLAAFIGAGGLGDFIVLGSQLRNEAILLVGAIPVAIMAVLAEVGMSSLQKALEVPA